MCNHNMIIKGMSGQPKETNVLENKRTTVSTKESNFHVGRSVDKSVIVKSYANFNRLGNTNSIQRRTLASYAVRFFSTKSGQTSKVLNDLADLRKFASNHPDRKIDRDLYKKFVLKRDLFLIAYDKLKSNPGMMTPGINPTTLDGMSVEVIDRLIESLKNESFKFTPARRIFIPKASGSKSKRPLSVGSPIDKLVQEVIRIVLETIYEPTFKDVSHGFRPNRSCHTALRTIFTTFQGCT
ncbi:hypothetical protein ACS49_05090 [Bacillus cereus]|nr:hypothetical protein ACS49_05090 [Bacillus cereus]